MIVHEINLTDGEPIRVVIIKTNFNGKFVHIFIRPLSFVNCNNFKVTGKQLEEELLNK